MIGIGAMTHPDLVAFSARGEAAAVYAKTADRLEVISGLPAEPKVGSLPGFGKLGEPVRFAVSDDGSAVVALMADGTPLSYAGSEGWQRLPNAFGARTMLFVPNTHNLVISDPAQQLLTLLLNLGSSRILAQGIQADRFSLQQRGWCFACGFFCARKAMDGRSEDDHASYGFLFDDRYIASAARWPHVLIIFARLIVADFAGGCRWHCCFYTRHALILFSKATAMSQDKYFLRILSFSLLLLTLSLVRADAAVTVNCTLPAGQVGVAYIGGSCTASGGTSPYTFSVVGSLPAGLGLSAPTATSTAVAGTPTTAGTTFSFSISAMDSSPTPVSGSAAETMTVSPAALTLTCAAPLAAQVGLPIRVLVRRVEGHLLTRTL